MILRPVLYCALCLAAAVGVATSMARAQTGEQSNEYRQLCERKLGAQSTGLILRDLGDEQWEVIAVASGPIIERNRTDANQAYREAILIADALAHQAIAEFIAGVQVKGTEDAISESKVVIDSRDADRARESLLQQVRSRQQQDVFAFLRGTRRVAEWRSAGVAFAVVTLNQSDIQTGVDISRTIVERELGADRFEVVQTSGLDKAPQRVRVVGMAAIGSRPLPEARRVAVYDGLHLAVQRVAGLTLSNRTSLEDLRRLESKLSSVTAGMVKSFLILDESRSGDTFTVLLEVHVQRDLGGNLDLLHDLLGNIKVAIAGNKGLFDGNYCLELCRRGLEQRGVASVNLGFSRARYSDGSGREGFSVESALDEAKQQGVSVLIWCDTDEWLQAYCVATYEAIGPRLSARSKQQDGRMRYGWEGWEPWNSWFDNITAHWYDEVFNGTFVSINLRGQYLENAGKWYASWEPSPNAAREVAGRIEDLLQPIRRCKGVKRRRVEQGYVWLVVRWAGHVDDLEREVFERSQSTVLHSDMTLEWIQVTGNTINALVCEKPPN